MSNESQINMQDIQRLNEMLVITTDALRRVVPHLFVGGYPGYGVYGTPMETPTYPPTFVDPISLAHAQAHLNALRAILTTQSGQVGASSWNPNGGARPSTWVPPFGGPPRF